MAATSVADNNLHNLEGLSKLKLLNLNRTKVTDVGADKLQRALPDLKIMKLPDKRKP